MAGGKGPPPDPVTVLRGHRASVTALKFLEPSLLVSGDLDGELKIWDLVKRRPHVSARVHNPASGVIGIGIDKKGGNKILSQGRDGTVKFWQLAEGSLSREPLMTIHTEAYHFCKLSVCRSASVPMDPSVGETSDALVESSHDVYAAATQGSLTSGTGKSYLALAGRDPSMVELWDMDAGKLALQFGQDTSGQSSPQTKSSGMCMALEVFTRLTREGFLHILTGYEDGSVAIWDVRNVKVPQFMKRFHQEPVLSIAVDGPCLGGVSGAADNQLIFFSINYQQNLLQIRGEIALGNPGTADISLRNDDRIVATAGWDHRVRIYDYKRSRALAILKYHSDLVNAVCFSEDCEFLASASKDGMVALWSIYPPQKDDLRTI